MSSGYGSAGGPSRCFPFWQEVLACYVVNTSAEDVSGQAKCKPALEDYYECLHHKKELAKVRAMQQEYAKRLLKNGREESQSVGEIRRLGLIPDQKPEDVDMKPHPYIPHRGPSIT
ncbi:MAG: hypothetical protein Q9159_004801 [Coniocarpon cinnabarinum]